MKTIGMFAYQINDKEVTEEEFFKNVQDKYEIDGLVVKAFVPTVSYFPADYNSYKIVGKGYTTVQTLPDITAKDICVGWVNNSTYIGEVSVKSDSPEKIKSTLEDGFKRYSEGHSTRHKASNTERRDLVDIEIEKSYQLQAKKIIQDLEKKEGYDIVNGQQVPKYLAKAHNQNPLKDCKLGVNKNSLERDLTRCGQLIVKNLISKDSQGVKHSDGKLFYEFDWEFIEAAAKRMQENKGKYPRWNWKKPIDIEDIKQALNRHHIEVMKGNYKDGEDELGHILSYMCNGMVLWHQLKNNK